MRKEREGRARAHVGQAVFGVRWAPGECVQQAGAGVEFKVTLKTWKPCLCKWREKSWEPVPILRRGSVWDGDNFQGRESQGKELGRSRKEVETPQMSASQRSRRGHFVGLCVCVLLTMFIPRVQCSITVTANFNKHMLSKGMKG